ncbi:MAG TPA: hypothetical protein VFR32_11605 [Gaiellaceae bacterium]|nr:hypothetical protein [Gaiellaceae bacterium]
MAIQRLRERMPLGVFVLVALVCLVLIGFACACLTDSPAQALERAVSALAHLPALTAGSGHALLALGLALIGAWAVSSSRYPARGSPELLQRFLF